jgi:hypothetical protein
MNHVIPSERRERGIFQRANYRMACARVLAALGMTVASVATAQKPPAIRALGPIVQVSSTPLKSVAAAIPLRDGRVYVNDITSRRVLLFDSSLATATVVADTTDATANAYGQRGGTLIRFRGDSVLYLDATSLSMLVLGPQGTIARVMAIPRPEDAQFMIGGLFGTPAFDPSGRLAYYSGAPPAFSMTTWGGKPPTNITGPMASFFAPKIDSANVVRVDLTSRALDTVAAIAIPKVRRFFPTGTDGNIASIQTERDRFHWLSDLPDYMPPFSRGATTADTEDNLWIRTSTVVNGQPVYDIVNRRGELADRVQLPPFRTIAGFGPRTVFLAVKDSAGVVHLEQACVK